MRDTESLGNRRGLNAQTLNLWCVNAQSTVFEASWYLSITHSAGNRRRIL